MREEERVEDDIKVVAVLKIEYKKTGTEAKRPDRKLAIIQVRDSGSRVGPGWQGWKMLRNGQILDLF